MIFEAIIKKEEDMFVATCKEVGTTSQGSNIDEALDNLKEATELYLEEFPESLDNQSIVRNFEVSINENK